MWRPIEMGHRWPELHMDCIWIEFNRGFLDGLDLVARIPALLLGCGFPNLLDIVDAV